MVRVARVAARSIAEEIGIVAGTELLSVNGREHRTTFSTGSSSPPTTSSSSRRASPTAKRSSTRSSGPKASRSGVELEPPTVRRCANRCEFCFIEGLPKGLRKPLYIRDDDYRLSFAYGNFATLSNVKERDIAADSRVPAVAAVRLGARDATGKRARCC